MPKLCFLDLKRALWVSRLWECPGILPWKICSFSATPARRGSIWLLTFCFKGSGAAPVCKPLWTGPASAPSHNNICWSQATCWTFILHLGGLLMLMWSGEGGADVFRSCALDKAIRYNNSFHFLVGHVIELQAGMYLQQVPPAGCRPNCLLSVLS